MPISSAGRQIKATSATSRRSYWPNAKTSSSSAEIQADAKSISISSLSKKTDASNQQAYVKYRYIRHISPSHPVTKSTTPSLKNSEHTIASDVNCVQITSSKTQSKTNAQMPQPSSINIGGQLVLTSSKQPISIGSMMNADTNRTVSSHGSGKTYLTGNAQYATNLKSSSQSRTSLNPPTTTSSTAHLHSLSDLAGTSNTSHPLSIKRNVNLKYIKALIILLMSIDMLITVFVHQFSTQDQIPIWFTTYKLRFSLLNLLLGAIWFITMVGAVLFDVFSILVIGCIVDISSLVLLFVLSIVHFTQRIDYNSVNLTSLLMLLFAIIVLHVYMIVMTALTVYLMLIVKQRLSSVTR